MVSTRLKNISQNGNLPKIGVNIKNIWNHHPARISWRVFVAHQKLASHGFPTWSFASTLVRLNPWRCRLAHRWYNGTAVSGVAGKTTVVCFQCVFLALVHVDSTDSMLLGFVIFWWPGILGIFTDSKILLLFFMCENLGFAYNIFSQILVPW